MRMRTLAARMLTEPRRMILVAASTSTPIRASMRCMVTTPRSHGSVHLQTRRPHGHAGGHRALPRSALRSRAAPRLLMPASTEACVGIHPLVAYGAIIGGARRAMRVQARAPSRGIVIRVCAACRRQLRVCRVGAGGLVKVRLSRISSRMSRVSFPFYSSGAWC
jgi:hypothetical protein